VEMKMTCPHCGVVGSAHGSMPGGKVRCPQCDKVFKVMGQKLACPHCGVVGSPGDSLPGTKLRCPRCEKVFLLTPERLAGESGRGVAVAAVEGVLAATATGVGTSAGTEWVSPVVEPEPIVEPVVEMELEPEVIAEAEPEPELLLEAEVVVESEPVTEPAGTVEADQVAMVQETEAGVKGEVVFEPVAEPAAELFVATELEPEVVPEAATDAEGLEPAAMPTDVCAGCGDSFHPEFLQEVDSKLYCGICQLRSAAKEQEPGFGGRKLWGMLVALMLLGLLALVVLALMKLGII